jgi:hypothetical protein
METKEENVVFSVNMRGGQCVTWNRKEAAKR